MCVCVYLSVYVCVCVCTRVYVCVCVYVCMCVCMPDSQNLVLFSHLCALSCVLPSVLCLCFAQVITIHLSRLCLDIFFSPENLLVTLSSPISHKFCHSSYLFICG